MEEVIVTYIECERYGKKRCYIEKNRRQEVILNKQKWCGYAKREERKVVCPREGKAQQSST